MAHIRNMALALFLLAAGSLLNAQSPSGAGLSNTRILFVFDASQSMSAYWESDKKINIARELLIDIVDSLQNFQNVQMGLRVYGHQSPVPPQDCNDTRLEVAFATNNAHQIRQKLRFIQPRGTTPIAHSLELAADDFPPGESCRNIIILITDGIEACDGDPCAVSYTLQKKGIILKPFIIGIGMDPGFRETFDCVGHYFNAANEKMFNDVFDVIISQALNTTSAQVNLLDLNGNPTETNMNMTFYDRFSGKVMHQLIHTINHRGNPDTIYLDPLITYDLTIHTLPPVFVDSFRVTAGKHTIIAADTPQGYLVAKTKFGNPFPNSQFIVRIAGSSETLNYQEFNKKEKYLVGNYDLEIPTLPKILLHDVNIRANHTTSIEIPRPGIVSFRSLSPGYGSVYVHRDHEVQWISNLDENMNNQPLYIQPGLYSAVFRPGSSKYTTSTVRRTFEIKSGSSVMIEFF